MAKSEQVHKCTKSHTPAVGVHRIAEYDVSEKA